MNIHIRRLRVADARGVARVRVTTWRAAYRGLFPDRILAEMNVDEDTLHWQEIIAAQPPENCAFAAEVDGTEIAGYCFAGPEREQDAEYTAEVYAIYVLPQYQGQGIGKRLVQAAVTCLQKQGHERMLLWVLRDNFPARKFYESIGGKVVRERLVEIRGTVMPEVAYGYDLTIWPKVIGENENFVIP